MRPSRLRRDQVNNVDERLGNEARIERSLFDAKEALWRQAIAAPRIRRTTPARRLLRLFPLRGPTP